MKTRLSIAIMWIIWARLESNEAAAANSGERVHIRLHMPEIVRKHTHFHKVFKQLPIPVPHHPPPPQHHHSRLPHHYSQLMPLGKPHVSLLGYTTTASGSGGMSPSLMQLMATAATPTMAPQYGPALFNSYTQQAQEMAEEAGLKEATNAMKSSGSSGYLGTAPATSTMNKQQQQQQQQQLLQQLFTPNLMAAIKAAQQHQDREMKDNQALGTEMEEPQPELELEHNELLNGNFLAALQREYISKFVKPAANGKRKKTNFVTSSSNGHVQEQYDDYHEEQPALDYEDMEEEEEEHEPYTMRSNSWGDHGNDHVRNYDSAVPFSGQNNDLGFVPSVDEFLKEVNNGKSYATFHGNMYDDYEPTGSNSWQAFKTHYTTPTRPLRKRRPSTDMATGYDSTGKTGRIRYIKLIKRKKRKNRIKTKRYRI